MNSVERRREILEYLKNEKSAIKGQELADRYSVTRQVIVKDIAIMRAKGEKILSTPGGYEIGKESTGIHRIIAVNHSGDNIYDELKIVIKHGGKVRDVLIEHPVYGEITAVLMIKTLYDIEKWIEKMTESSAKPLSNLTDGIHLHTITAESEEIINRIIDELDEKGFLIDDKE